MASSRADVSRRWSNQTLWVLPVDIVCVLAFVLIGRASHAEGEGLGGVLTVLWPFATGLALGWAFIGTFGLVRNGWRAGVCAAVPTVAVGMLLRAVSGQGVALSFIIVATVFLLLFLLGWRLLVPAATRLLSR